MTGPLVSVDSVPDWLRPLVRVSGELDSLAFTSVSLPKDSNPRPAAVLVLFGERSSGPDVLLLRRAKTLGFHAGQVAFPGGGADAKDDGPVDTALREAQEETGVNPVGVLPVAILPELLVPVSQFAVTPVLAYWARPSPVRAIDAGETAAVARLAIADLADPVNRFQVQLSGTGWQGPAFEVDGMFIWGFTAGLLAVLLTLGGWDQTWDCSGVRDLHVALAEYETRAEVTPGPGVGHPDVGNRK